MCSLFVDQDSPTNLETRLDFLLIGARNTHVKEGLQKAHSSEVPEGELDIFCVSNTVYEKYCRKGNREYVEASGIPELRRFCHSITAEAQFREARHFLHSSLASLLNSLGLWAGSRLRAHDQQAVIFCGSMQRSLMDSSEKVMLAPTAG